MSNISKRIIFLLVLFLIIFQAACSPSDSEQTEPTQTAASMPSSSSADVSESSSTPEPQPTETPVPPTATSTVTPLPTATPHLIQQSVAIPVSGDTYVSFDPANGDGNYGEREFAVFGGDFDNNDIWVLLDFDVFDYVPRKATITDAELQLTAREKPYWGFPFTIHPILADWNEYTVTANYLPAYDETNVVSYNLDEINLAMSFPITDIVQKWVDGEIEEHGILLTADVYESIGQFYTKEGGLEASPILYVAYEMWTDETAPEETAVTWEQFHTEPDLLLTLTPWERLRIGVENFDINDVAMPSGLVGLAEKMGLDLKDSAELGQLGILMNEMFDLTYGNERNVPIAIAESPDISLNATLASLQGGFIPSEPLEITTEDVGLSWTGCNEEICSSTSILVLTEGDLTIKVTDGFMMITMQREQLPKIGMLDLIDVKFDGRDLEDETSLLNSIFFFRIMHDTFGIPYDSIRIYPYDGIGNSEGEDFWPEKYLSLYWSADGEYIVPRPTAGDLTNWYDDILEYDIRIDPPHESFMFRRWLGQMDPNGVTLNEPDALGNLILIPCHGFCTQSLFDNEIFHERYYSTSEYPFDTVQIKIDTITHANHDTYWLVGYLTNKPILAESQ